MLSSKIGLIVAFWFYEVSIYHVSIVLGRF